MLLTLFSPVADAEEIDVPPYHVYIVGYLSQKDSSSGTQQNAVNMGYTVFPHDGTVKTITFSATNYYPIKTTEVRYTFVSDSNSYFLAKNELANITIENVKRIVNLSHNGTDIDLQRTRIDDVSVYITYTDGSIEYCDAEYIAKSNGYYDISFTIDAQKNISKIDVTTYDTVDTVRKFINMQYGEFVDTDLNVRIDLQDKKIGLLQNIISNVSSGFSELGSKISNGLSNVVNKLTDGFSQMTTGITNLFNSIKELPSKLWDVISQGLKNLFVPSENYMVEYKEDWDMLLSQKLGAVYEVSEIIFGAWDDVKNADQTNTINFPSVSIPIGDNQEFTFGGYDVQIVPEGFTVLVDAVKLAIGGVCTFMFVNGLRKRYDEVMGVEK